LGLLLLTAAPANAAGKAPPDPLERFQWHLPRIQAPAAWGVSRGAGVTIAVLDTGVAYENRGPYRRAPELAAARLVGGHDFVGGDAHPDDVPPPGGRRSHGTQIATIIAATAGNGVGGSGVAPEASIMPVRVLRPDTGGSARAIAAGLRFAADHGAQVANLSIAGPAPSRALRDAVRYATRKGVTIVAAAGNDGGSRVSWPAAYPEVIAVGAVGKDLRRASYSNTGAALDLVAPGGEGDDDVSGFGPQDGVLGQTLKGGPATFCFCLSASTSAAAAEVSGVAALLIASGRATTPAAIRAALRRSARDLGAPGRDDAYGAGLVQAKAALDGARASDRPVAATPDQPAGGGGPDAAAIAAIAVVVLVALALALVVRRRRA
jgi:serine protease